MDECVFCAIEDGNASGSFVYEDESVFGVLTIEPVNTGHTLVIPRIHVPSLSDIDETTGALLFQAAMRIAARIRDSDVPCEGFNFWIADGVVAGQEVSHLHLHILPRLENDGFHVEANRTQPTREELDATADEVRSTFD